MIDFPNSPTVGQIFTSGTASWQWDGTKWVSISSGPFLPLAGGTMSGLLTLSGAPTANLHAATKLYVDTAPFLPLTGNRARIFQGSASNPAATTSTSAVMAGMGTSTGPFLVTPRVTGVLDVTIQGIFAPSAAGASAYMSMRYGTGTPPANGAGPTGTILGPNIGGIAAGAAQQLPFSINASVSGLTLNTQYWFDLGFFVSSGNVQLYNLSFKAVEL